MENFREIQTTEKSNVCHGRFWAFRGEHYALGIGRIWINRKGLKHE